MKEVLLYTPGVDSKIASWILKSEYNKTPVKCYVDVGSMYSSIEKSLLSLWRVKNVVFLNGLKMSSIEDSKTAYIPNRNALIAIIVQSFLNCDVIYFAAPKDDNVNDSSIEFRNKLSELLTISNNRKIRVESVLDTRDKSEWIALYSFRTKKKLELFEKTYSCYSYYLTSSYTNYYYYHCGKLKKSSRSVSFFGCRKCKACFRRLAAFSAANIYLPMKEDSSQIISEYLSRFLTEESFNNDNSARAYYTRKYLLTFYSKNNTVEELLNEKSISNFPVYSST